MTEAAWTTLSSRPVTAPGVQLSAAEAPCASRAPRSPLPPSLHHHHPPRRWPVHHRCHGTFVSRRLMSSSSAAAERRGEPDADTDEGATPFRERLAGDVGVSSEHDAKRLVLGLSSDERLMFERALVKVREDEAWRARKGGGQLHPVEHECQADQIFQTIDDNKDGFVSRREFRNFYNSIVLPAREVQQAKVSELNHQLNQLKAWRDRQGEGAHAAPGADGSAGEGITSNQLALVLIRGMIPYIGFGLCDNALMLVAGEWIDKTAGAAFCLSTLASAGFGNLISCATGVVTGGFIERFSYQIGVPSPNLTPQQAESQSVKNLHIIGSVLGICVGCFIGMFPLYFLPTANGNGHGNGGHGSGRGHCTLDNAAVKAGDDECAKAAAGAAAAAAAEK